MKLSDEEEEKEEKEEENDTSNNKEDDSKMNKIKNEVQNLDGCLAGYGNCRSRFLPKLYLKKKLEMLLRLLKGWNESCQDSC